MPPSIIVLLDNIVAVLRQSPATVEHQRSSPHRRADGTHPRHFAGSESGDRHRAERVLEFGGAVVSMLDRSDREDVRLLPLRCVNASVAVYEGT